MPISRRALLVIVAVVAGFQSPVGKAESHSTVRIDKGTVVCVAEDAPEPVRRAVQDLASDMNKVFGEVPQVVHAAKADVTNIVIGQACSNRDGKVEGKSESFSIQILAGKAPHSSVGDVYLNGTDMRGTMYAIYSFSEKILGVDPMYYWTDNQPRRRETIDIPVTFSYQDPGPLFRFRGFFINDEDLLTGWAPGKPEDHSGISLTVWNHVFETILRLKGNTVVPGTWIFPDDGQVRLVGERGLWLSQHHATPLGVNAARWPQGVPYNYSTHPEIIQKAWRNSVDTYAPNQDVLWEVGLRGLSDQPYSALDPSVRNNDALLGKRISEAITEQEKIVREHHPNAIFVTDLWMEGNKLMRQGLLNIPKGTITVWSDTGYGKVQDDGQVAAGQGVYLHIAMMNNRANQLTEMVPTERLLSETKRIADIKATQFYLVNTSDIRPVVMSARAVMEAAWGSLSKGQSDSYYQEWARTEFGAAASEEVADVYKMYFTAPARDKDDREYGDQYYHATARQMLLSSEIDWPTFVLPDQAPNWQGAGVSGINNRAVELKEAITREQKACSEARPRWEAVYAKAVHAETDVEPSRREFYQSSVLTMIEINMESNAMLLDVANAISAKDSGNTPQAIADIRRAEAALDRIKVSESKAEYGRWKNWYRGDWLTGVDRTRGALAQYEKFLEDPSTPIAAPIRWADWEAYYHILHYEGDRTVDVQ